MKRILTIWSLGLSSSTTDEFKSFARKFKNDFAKELKKRDATITAFTIGHYYFSGFFRTKENNCFYFSISDVRHFHDKRILYRVAKNESDFKGGINRYIDLSQGMGEKMNLN